MKQKIKAKSNYKARGSSVGLYCSVHICTEPKHAANHGARSVPTVRNDEGGGRIEPELCNGQNDAHTLRPVSG